MAIVMAMIIMMLMMPMMMMILVIEMRCSHGDSNGYDNYDIIMVIFVIPMWCGHRDSNDDSDNRDMVSMHHCICHKVQFRHVLNKYIFLFII